MTKSRGETLTEMSFDTMTLLDLHAENGGDPVNIALARSEYELMEMRRTREFFVRCSPERLYAAIDGANSDEELGAAIVKYGLCDTFDISDCDEELIKKGLCAVARSLYKFPKLRGRLCYIGSSAGYVKKLNALASGGDGLRQWGLQHILSRADGARAARLVADIVGGTLGRSDYLAAQVKAFGFFDGIIFDESEVGGRRDEFLRKLNANEKNGFHPRSCNTVESVVYHEIGHILDELCGLSRNEAFLRYRSSLSDGVAADGLSKYALCSNEEFIAEAVSEYLSGAPREISQKTVALLQVAYKYI